MIDLPEPPPPYVPYPWQSDAPPADSQLARGGWPAWLLIVSGLLVFLPGCVFFFFPDFLASTVGAPTFYLDLGLFFLGLGLFRAGIG